MQDYFLPLFPNDHYHIFNRAVGSDLLFPEDKDYRYFISRVKKYLLPVADFYCYNLLPNHFHFFARIKEEIELEKAYKNLHPGRTTQFSFGILPDFVLQQFSNCFNAYTKKFNAWYNRKGRLFMESVRRIPVEDDSYFTQIIHYIHANAVQHGICETIEEWKHSSYHALVSDRPTLLKREEILDWFWGPGAIYSVSSATDLS